MKKSTIFLLFVFAFALPSWANGNLAMTISRTLMENMAKESPEYFARMYIVGSTLLDKQVSLALFSPEQQMVEVPPILDTGRDFVFSTAFPLNINTAPLIEEEAGYMTSFEQASQKFAQKTGLEYSDMAFMLDYALQTPTERNFAGYFVNDFRELQLAAIRPATGQTLKEALRTAYQQAQKNKNGILIITEESPERVETFRRSLYKGGPKVDFFEAIPAGLKDMYVLDWENGHWISYRQSVLDPLVKGGKKGLDSRLPYYGATVAEKEGYLEVEYGLVMADYRNNPVFCVRHSIKVPSDSPWFKQLKYAKEKGYYILIQDLPGVEPGVREDDLSKVTFWFARKRGEPFFTNPYEL